MANSSNEACDFCGITFECTILFNIHSWSHVPYENVPNFIGNVTKCEECDSEFSSNQEWKRHASSSHGRSPYACTFCALIYADLESLTNHIIKNHPRCLNLVQKKAKFGCILCGLTFTVANALCQHLQSSHGQISLILINQNIYPSSEIFDAGQRNQNTMVKSILRVGYDRQYNSGKSQKDQNIMIKVNKKVTFSDDQIGDIENEKPRYNRNNIEVTNKYRCGLCGSTFKHGIQLKIHRKEKHKAIIGSLKPKFGCGCCNANFYSKKFVRNHIAKHHNINVTPKKVVSN